MSIKEKLESLGKNSIELKIAGKEKYKQGATRFGGDSRMCRRTSSGPPMRGRATTMW